MISRTDEIQQLIEDIDSLLASSGKRLSRLWSGQAQEGQELLLRIREFLVKLSENEELKITISDESSEQMLSPLLAKFVEQGSNQPASHSTREPEPQNIIGSEFKSEFSALIQPLQLEISGLIEERATLVQEIRQLEQKRLQNYSLTQQLANQEQMIAEFLQVLMNRLEPNLTLQSTPNLANPSSSAKVSENENISPAASISLSLVESSGQVEQLARLAKELDQRLLSLDGTVNVVFDALQRNIITYHQSLSQALGRMYNQGMQGEQLMANFLQSLNQLLQHQSSMLQSSFLEGEENSTLPLLLSNLTPIQVEPLSQNLDELIQLDNTSSLTNSPPIPDTTTSDLDALILQLTTDNSLQLNTSTDINSPELPLNVPEVIDEQVISPELPLNVSELINEQVISPELPLNVSELINEQVISPEPPLNKEEILDDEVDELYASLFGNQDATNLGFNPIPVVINHNLPSLEPEISAPKITLDLRETYPAVTPPENSSTTTLEPQEIINELADINLVSLDHNPELEISETMTPGNFSIVSPSIDEGATSSRETSHPKDISQPILSSWETLFLAENKQPKLENSTPDYSVVEKLDFHPPNSETITVLTDLLVDIGTNQPVLKVPSPENHPAPTTKAPVTELPGKIKDYEQNNYIPASPQENLLSLEEVNSSTVSDIVLDEEQLRQLDRDLANFAWQINSSLDSDANLDNLPNIISNSQDDLSIATSPPPNANHPSGDFLRPSVENTSKSVTSSLEISQPEVKIDFSSHNFEKKKEVTSPSLENPEISIPPSFDNSLAAVNSLPGVWYLGIDLGTTGISAALLNRTSCTVYPIYWSAESQAGTNSFQQSFRLPAEVYLPTASTSHTEANHLDGTEQTTLAGVTPSQDPGTDSTNHLYSAQLKSYLQIAIPYKTSSQKWEPVLQLNEFSAGPLIWVVRSLSKLLLTLKSDQTSTTPALISGAVGIDRPTFLTIINHLAGIICSCPSSYSEQYRFNVREALLQAKLISHPQQVFFVEEAIASLLPELDSGNGERVQLSHLQGLQLIKNSEHPLLGNTLAINIGAAATEMALVDLPENLGQLTHHDFMLHNFGYGGKGIEQDIICQLLFPPKSRQSRPEFSEHKPTNHNNSWQWQPSIMGLDKMHWDSLGLEKLELPKVGEPDITARIRLQQRLEASLLGQAVLDSALALKLILQHQESFTLELADQRWVLQRKDLESLIFVPFVRRLNRELNKLLVARGIPTEAINQAILTGGVAGLGTVNRWLRQKLPNAKMIPDGSASENSTSSCSKVALGVVMLPLHPQVLEISRQQYTDYFLFTELLGLVSDKPISFSEVIRLFEGRGINTRTCQQRLLAFLEGELPPGLIPTSFNIWLTQNSQENPDYQAITSMPLFEKQGLLTYRPHPQQLIILRRYLDAVKASTQQSLEEPYIVNFALTTG